MAKKRYRVTQGDGNVVETDDLAGLNLITPPYETRLGKPFETIEDTLADKPEYRYVDRSGNPLVPRAGRSAPATPSEAAPASPTPLKTGPARYHGKAITIGSGGAVIVEDAPVREFAPGELAGKAVTIRGDKVSVATPDPAEPAPPPDSVRTAEGWRPANWYLRNKQDERAKAVADATGRPAEFSRASYGGGPGDIAYGRLPSKPSAGVRGALADNAGLASDPAKMRGLSVPALLAERDLARNVLEQARARGDNVMAAKMQAQAMEADNKVITLLRNSPEAQAALARRMGVTLGSARPTTTAMAGPAAPAAGVAAPAALPNPRETFDKWAEESRAGEKMYNSGLRGDADKFFRKQLAKINVDEILPDRHAEWAPRLKRLIRDAINGTSKVTTAQAYRAVKDRLDTLVSGEQPSWKRREFEAAESAKASERKAADSRKYRIAQTAVADLKSQLASERSAVEHANRQIIDLGEPKEDKDKARLKGWQAERDRRKASAEWLQTRLGVERERLNDLAGADTLEGVDADAEAETAPVIAGEADLSGAPAPAPTAAPEAAAAPPSPVPADVAQLEDGRLYMSPSGQVGRWDAKSSRFVPPGGVQ